MGDSKKKKLKLPYEESELVFGLTEYTSHAGELARLDIEIGWMKDESSETKR
ncbi:MAG: hypothetical protein ACQEVQ_06600 [Pseudomonadota bacterium]